MRKSNESARIAQILNEKQSIAICLPQNPNLDAVASATALYLTLLHMGKQVSIAAPEEVNAQFGLAGQDKIQNQLSTEGNTLSVSFPYTEGAVDKVTYNIEGDRFNLLISPKEGMPKLDHTQVKFNYSGGKADVIITIYTPTLQALGNLYNSQKDKFTGVEIINVDRHFTNNNYGTVNLVDKKAASMSEIVTDLLRALNAKLDKDIATNLYSGIVSATNSFMAHAVTADTFESSAFLLNAGAVRKAVQPMQPIQPVQPTQIPPAVVQQQPQPQPQPVAQPQQVEPSMPQSPEDVQNMVQPGTAENKESASSSNWLKPKIFEGSNLI
ncbi:MAG: Bifunctional oligoribonuclease and PAP phosphatase NrnA [Microgenomates bacterium OLB23]|nr:MAG: Bifunctional oligoribonuclease and PAP phosphatase NrnA [Microgenomates bacterium OLB23]